MGTKGHEWEQSGTNGHVWVWFGQLSTGGLRRGYGGIGEGPLRESGVKSHKSGVTRQVGSLKCPNKMIPVISWKKEGA